MTAAPCMRATLLGSGIASGVPAWNDGGPQALRARERDPEMPRRAGAALAVTADGLRYSILEAPFHLPATLADSPRYAPAAGSRAVPIDTLMITSGDLDASAGALGLRAGLAVRVASPSKLRSALIEHDAAFATLEPLWSGLAWDRPFPLDREEHLEARVFPLPGPAPDHLRELDAASGRSRCGVRITDRRTGKRLVWAPRIGLFDSATLAELQAADVRFIDGTCYAEQEARLIRPGARTVSDLGHATIDGRRGSLAFLAGMEGRSIYVHLAASNPIARLGTEERERILRAGVEIATDGMEFEI